MTQVYSHRGMFLRAARILDGEAKRCPRRPVRLCKRCKTAPTRCQRHGSYCGPCYADVLDDHQRARQKRKHPKAPKMLAFEKVNDWPEIWLASDDRWEFKVTFDPLRLHVHAFWRRLEDQGAPHQLGRDRNFASVRQAKEACEAHLKRMLRSKVGRSK